MAKKIHPAPLTVQRFRGREDIFDRHALAQQDRLYTRILRLLLYAAGYRR